MQLEIIPDRVFYDKQSGRIGSGTYSTVYMGQYLGTEVAVKRFRNSDSASLKAWRQEVEIMRWFREKGSHPSII